MLRTTRIVRYHRRGALWALGVALFAFALAVFGAASTRAEPSDRSRSITARPGDTVTRIAKRSGVSEQGIIRLNDLKRPYRIAPGQRLRLPSAMVHVVRRGERVADIARRYSVARQWLIRLNDLRRPYRLLAGQRLFLPKSGRRAMLESRSLVERTEVLPRPPEGPGAPTPPQVYDAGPKANPRVRRKATRLRRIDRPHRTAQLRRIARPSRIGRPPPLSGRGFAWPLRGRILTRYGTRGRGIRNDGINIAARAGTTVRAAENGVVIYAGSDIAGLGEVLLIKHAGGWVTAYAHNARLLVRRGQVVRRRQPIAKVGTTGAVLRPQLLFQIRKGERPVNPLTKLRRQRTVARR